MRDFYRNILLLVFWVVLFLPLIQMNSSLIPVKGLRGGADPLPFPQFTVKEWFKGDFQQQFVQSMEENLGFRPWLVRYKNQIEYSLFRRSNASGVIVGKKGYLFEKDYVRAYQGTDYLGDYFWDEKFKRLGLVSDTLQKLGKQFILVLEPGKATYHPEFIPNRYKQSETPSANYRAIIEQANNKDITFLDLNRYFVEQKNRAEYLLFPKGGIHWSVGGMLSCVDTLVAFLNKNTSFQFPDMVMGDLNLSKQLQDTDDDLVQISNLAWPPAHPEMAYPDYHFEGSDTIKKPKALVISDSFFFNIINNKLTDSLFGNSAFWYYNKTIYPDSWSSEKLTSQIDTRQYISDMDLIILMVTERFYYKFDWEIIDQMYDWFYPGHEIDYVYDYFRMIIRNYEWFDNIYAQSVEMNQSMESLLLAHAGYQFWVDDQKEAKARDLPYYRMKIMTDQEWMKQIRAKAGVNNISVPEQIDKDAKWKMAQDLQSN